MGFCVVDKQVDRILPREECSIIAQTLSSHKVNRELNIHTKIKRQSGLKKRFGNRFLTVCLVTGEVRIVKMR